MLTSLNEDKARLYKRDILRDYCLAAAELDTQFIRFANSGSLSFSILRGIIGDQFSKGRLWRLKDTAHHLFGGGANSPAGSALDWSIGFLFHECTIILESSYQLKKYYPSASSMRRGQHRAEELEKVRIFLLEQALDTQHTLGYLVKRTGKMLAAINKLFCLYLEGDSQNRPLARLLYDREDLMRRVFKDLYPELMLSIYGNNPEGPLLEAALSLHESGQLPRAERAARKALELNPACNPAQDLINTIKSA